MKNSHRIFLVVLTMFFVVNIAQADDGDWDYAFITYLLASGMDGTTAVLGREVEVDASFSDIWDHLEFGVMAHFEASNDKWVIIGDLFYVGLGAQPPAVTVDVNQWIVEGGLGRKLGQNFVLLGGARFNRLDAKLGFRGPIGIEVEGDQNFLDPYIGARVMAPLSDRFLVSVRGDIGGFGLGSDFAWYFNPALVIDLTESISLVGFYRWHHLDYENEDDGFLFDVTISGPGAGLGFHF